MKTLVRNLAVVALLAGCGPDTANDTGPTDYTGVWSATWSFHVDLIDTGTNFARNCSFTGSATFEVWGENNFGPVNGTESMTCDNATNPGAQFELGGNINGKSDVVSGRFFYWGEDSISFAGKCSSMNACHATGANSFALDIVRTP